MSRTTRTKKSKGPLWDGRGRNLYSIEVTFVARGSAQSWRRFVDAMNFEVIVGNTDPDGWGASFAALPAVLEPRGYYMHGRVHLHTEEQEAHWTIGLQQAPDINPPKGIVSLSERVGGYPAIIEKLAAEWPSAPSISGQITATYYVNKKQWKFAVEDVYQRSVGTAAKTTHTLMARTIDWDVEPASGPIARLTVALTDDPSLFVISGTGTATVTMSPSLLSKLDDAMWSGLESLLVQNKGE